MAKILAEEHDMAGAVALLRRAAALDPALGLAPEQEARRLRDQALSKPSRMAWPWTPPPDPDSRK